MTTTTSETHNYTCKTGAAGLYCSQPAFAPNGSFSSTAWDRESAECSVSLGFLIMPCVVPRPLRHSGRSRRILVTGLSFSEYF